MSYPEEFKELLDKYKNSSIYMGTGNPNAKILIVGKECAIDTTTSQEQYKREIVNNWQNWCANEQEDIKQEDVELYQHDNPSSYNPLYPYRGQNLKIRTERKDGTVRAEGGTSATWCWYQRLLDKIVSNNNSKEVDFHEKCFISELSTACGQYSKDVVKKEREESIKNRIPLLKSDFFQQFPIVIIPAGHYPRDFKIDLEDVFGTRMIMQKELKGKFWINIHHGINTEPKLLIHTRQFSMISHDLVNTIADVCKEFISKNEITL